jgi:DNA polymerase III gamma/tau subunit
MAKKNNLTPKDAKEILEKFLEPPYNAEEIRLKDDVRLVLKGEGGGYEGDDDEEEEGDSPENNQSGGGAGEGAAQSAASQATQSQGSSVIENAQQYAGEIIANVQALGSAGTVAISSATYFQAETVVESSHDIVAIVEEVEEDYDMTLQNYFVETTATFIDDIAHIPIIENIPIVNTVVESAADSLYEVSDNMETKAERVERQEVEAEQKAAEQEAKAEAQAEAQAEQQEAKEQRQAERQEAKEQRQAERESKSEEKSEQKSEEAQEEQKSEAKSEEKSEAKSEEKSEPKAEEKSEQKSEEQKSEQKSEEPKQEEQKQEPKAEEPKSEPKSEPQAEEPKSEPKAEPQAEPQAEPKAEPQAETPIPETPMDNGMVDEIKPHSNIESNDAGGIMDIPRVETPFLNDPSVRPVSPVSSNNRSVSPIG